PKERGIAHFIEHLLFMGTKNRTPHEIVKAIEKVGGEFNAATTNDHTYYYAVVPKKHFNIALEILSDMIKNATFEDKYIGKERSVVFDEINMVLDDPKSYQWVLLEEKLFEKFPAKFPVYGSKETLKNVRRKELLNFYRKYYIPSNMIISVVGRVKDLRLELENKFRNFNGNSAFNRPIYNEKPVKDNILWKKELPTEQSYMTMAFRAVNRNHKDSYALDILETILGKGQSSRLFDQIRVKRGLAYTIAAYNNCHRDYGYFAISLATNKKNIENCKKLIFKELKLKKLSFKELADAKQAIEGNFLLKKESTRDAAEINSFWNLSGGNSADYIKKIAKTTLEDVKKAAKTYFSQKHVMVVMEQKA
ncbi:MAG TPA: pitrilysin family protein, partial [Candidatus Nanoarchaeia archaeon]|nr:pitrilysin family protein [Candidatus Nanoarchaeia archaeon]